MSKFDVALPGFEGMDFSDEKRYTGEVLYRDHPEVFKAVLEGFFKDRLGVREAALKFRVSVNTVRALRDMALTSHAGAESAAARAAFFIKSEADKLQGIVRNRALEVLLDKLSDPDEAAKISVDTLLKINADMQTLTGASNRPSSVDDGDVIDVEEFDSMLDGLDRGKKSAREGRSDDGLGDSSEVSGDGLEGVGDDVQADLNSEDPSSTGNDLEGSTHSN